MRFYTLPPDKIPYPYILVNARNPQSGLRYIKKQYKHIKSVILDSGIEIFRDKNVKDYPPGHITRITRLYYRVKQFVKEVWATRPDYCDDYHPGNLWLSPQITNIERTVENVVKCLDKYSEINWLIPIQGWNKKPSSVLRCLKLYEEKGVRGEYYAVANLCVERNDAVAIKTVRYIRGFLKHDVKLHVFGLKLPAAKKLRGEIDSFDSMAWTRPVNKKGHSCKNEKERIRYFLAYCKSLGIKITGGNEEKNAFCGEPSSSFIDVFLTPYKKH